MRFLDAAGNPIPGEPGRPNPKYLPAATLHGLLHCLPADDLLMPNPTTGNLTILTAEQKIVGEIDFLHRGELAWFDEDEARSE